MNMIKDEIINVKQYSAICKCGKKVTINYKPSDSEMYQDLYNNEKSKIEYLESKLKRYQELCNYRFG